MKKKAVTGISKRRISQGFSKLEQLVCLTQRDRLSSLRWSRIAGGSFLRLILHWRWPNYGHPTACSKLPFQIKPWRTRQPKVLFFFFERSVRTVRYRLVQVRQNLKKKTSGWRPAIAFLYLFVFHSLLRLTSFLSQYKMSTYAVQFDKNIKDKM